MVSEHVEAGDLDAGGQTVGGGDTFALGAHVVDDGDAEALEDGQIFVA